MLKTYGKKNGEHVASDTSISITLDLTAVSAAYEHSGGTMVTVGAHTYFIDAEHDDFVDDWKDAIGLLDE